MLNTKIFSLAVISSVFFLTPTLALAQSNPRAQAAVSKAQTNPQTQSCQAREATLKSRMSSLVNLVTNMDAIFSGITARVETFYSDKVIPTGKTVANYNALRSAIDTKKTAVQTALTKAQTDVNSFDCASGKASTTFTQFRLDMQAVKATLKDFRTSIKNLIVAVTKVS